MFRARFYVNAEDPRPVLWPINHPYWISGHTIDKDYELEKAIVVAYVDDERHLISLWPDAQDIDMGDEVTEIKFSDRFPKPDWYKKDSDQEAPEKK